MSHLQVLSESEWWGAGYCAVCGDHNVTPRQIRYWSPDDGWRVGVLCGTCWVHAAKRGPRSGDYAFDRAATDHVQSEDLDFAYSSQDD